jgi:hypothetical protein
MVDYLYQQQLLLSSIDGLGIGLEGGGAFSNE